MRLVSSWLFATILLTLGSLPSSAAWRRVVVPEGSHPAIRSAAAIMARVTGVPESAIVTGAVAQAGDLVLNLAPATPAPADDGYRVDFRNGAAIFTGNRPRSLLYAAGDWRLWRDRTSGTLVRSPSFRTRTAAYDGTRPVADFVAEFGANILIGKPNDATVSLKQRLPEVYAQLPPNTQAALDRSSAARHEQNRNFARQCRDADVSIYAFLYGNDFTLWSQSLYQAALKAYPSIKGTPAKASWEKAWLCPSDPLSWKLVRAYVEEFLENADADGLYATFWDRYGINCQCDRCRANGHNRFANQLYECVKAYHDAAAKRPVVVRTWSSGVPHWLGEEYVHAPGYDGFGGAGTELWSRVIADLPRDIVIQTKVYHADCQPDARFSPLLGKAAPHQEIAEYQISGQTVGRFYFPASSVDYNARTMREAYKLVGPNGGVNVFPGGTHQSDYSVSDDIANGINVYAWRQLSWDINEPVDRIWSEWAVPVFGERAAPHVVRALRLSEEAVNRTFSTLGMGSSTNSDFARTIARRETLLMYTNRQYLPEFAKFLEPARENITRVAEEKAAALKAIDEMLAGFEQARPNLTPAQFTELTVRTTWLKEFAICSRYLDESLWRYRYLRYLAGMLTTDPEQLAELAKARAAVEEHAHQLFRFDPSLKFSCYRTTLGELRIVPALGSPVPLMKELVEESRKLVEQIAGPDWEGRRLR